MPTVYLIPTVLAEGVVETIPAYVLDAIKDCQVIFAENERTARRFMKMLDKQIVIDNFTWHTIHKAEEEQVQQFRESVSREKNIAIISEAGCPGVADPGQILIAVAQELNCRIRPLVGPSAILLALMASGMNGQQFEFVGYLPVDANERIKRIRELEASSAKHDSTKIFIETPYRNNQLLESLMQHASSNSRLCIGADITSANESIITKTIAGWKKQIPNLHKVPVIFLLHAGK